MGIFEWNNFFFNLQVSYIIVDEADRDIEMENDPFLAAGIDIPEELPYQDQTGSVETLVKKVNGDKITPKSSPKSSMRARQGDFDIETRTRLLNTEHTSYMHTVLVIHWLLGRH